MLYRIVTLVGGIAFVGVLFGLIWLFCRLFLKHHRVTDQLNERAMTLATWTFTGVSLGLLFAIFGAFILGPWAFYRTLQGHDLEVSSGAAIWWGFGIVLLSLLITASGFLGFLWLVGVW
ncbi:hypothetical protein [uncultured Marinobacter sp.]|uniref:hypothetical protein n=1 Tax=uncultured Marinobacter sp. TaxID=187379 RepID=UPI0030D9947A